MGEPKFIMIGRRPGDWDSVCQDVLTCLSRNACVRIAMDLNRDFIEKNSKVRWEEDREALWEFQIIPHSLAMDDLSVEECEYWDNLVNAVGLDILNAEIDEGKRCKEKFIAAKALGDARQKALEESSQRAYYEALKKKFEP